MDRMMLDDLSTYVSWTDELSCLGPVSHGEKVVIYDAILFRSDEAPRSYVQCQRRVRAPFEIKGTVEELVSPVTSSDVEAGIRERATADISRAGNKQIILNWQPTIAELESLRGATLAASFELIHHGKLIATGAGWWDLSSHTPGSIVLEGEKLSSLPEEPGAFTLRIVGDPATALRNFTATAYWSGTIEVEATVSPSRWDRYSPFAPRK